MAEKLDVLLKEKRVFKPSKNFVEQTNVKEWMNKHGIKTYDDLLEKSQDTEWFWEEMSKIFLEFYSPYKKVMEWKPPYVKWFTGAKYNIVHDALDKHAKGKNKSKLAYIWEGEPGDVEKYTYEELYHEVNRLANGLKSIGIKKGDHVGIYLPMIPALPIAMLACAKIGAIHAVVFSGFSAHALHERMVDCSAKAVITCDGFYRRGKTVPLKKQTDEAVANTPKIKNTIVFKRTGETVPWNAGKDLWWHELLEKQDDECETEKMDANDTIFVLYTSGTTGAPKGVLHSHAGYALGISATMSWVFDIKDDDVWWCAADVGWITGHSYIVYAPLMLGTTSVMYEGAPDTPKPDRWWEIIEKYKVSILYTSPTSIRMFMSFGEDWVEKHNLSSLRLLGSVGEPINPEAWIWYYKHIGNKKCQIMDTWWQTETGHHCITPLPITDLKPGSGTKPFPGVSADVFDDSGKPVKNAGGSLVLLKPWPGMLRGLYKAPERFQETYWKKYPKRYLTGDMARLDEDGYFWVQGRADDVLSIAGHRIGNSEVESALVSHPKVAEAAVIGRPSEIKGESIVAFVRLMKGVEESDDLKKELFNHVGEEIGKIARPEEIWFVKDLPKTRSGKIMRRVIKSKALGKEVGDTSTLANPEAVDEIKTIV
ncbi:MAG: acetate--CoA ligase [Candidatus Aenigmarchaeota archaeon]|nr:acetate--CoA ligase [Candidatus Aenigmarchaeota archaeon]